jgi:membrane-bound ClpP family serine protease
MKTGWLSINKTIKAKEIFFMKLDLQNIQLILATMLILSGLLLLYMGIFMPPTGVIDGSVLVAFGETCTFRGALIGVDYHYRSKQL